MRGNRPRTYFSKLTCTLAELSPWTRSTQVQANGAVNRFWLGWSPILEQSARTIRNHQWPGSPRGGSNGAWYSPNFPGPGISRQYGSTIPNGFERSYTAPDKSPYLGDPLPRSQCLNPLNPGMIEGIDRHDIPPVVYFWAKNYFNRSCSVDQLFALIPIPSPNSARRARMVSLVETMLALHKQASAARLPQGRATTALDRDERRADRPPGL